MFACFLGGYVAMGGKIGMPWQPFEVVIIVGPVIGAVIVGNTNSNLGRIGRSFGNWELSKKNRALASRRVLVEDGLKMARISHVTEKAATGPIIMEDLNTSATGGF